MISNPYLFKYFSRIELSLEFLVFTSNKSILKWDHIHTFFEWVHTTRGYDLYDLATILN